MNRLPTLVRVADAAPTPWRNGGGTTRELLAWPQSKDWMLRASVADIQAPGAFSFYPGVDRWCAVLEGGAMRLDTAGERPQEMTASDPELHRFPGDAATYCTLLGAATRDFNLMAQRSRVRVVQQSLERCARLATRAAIAGLFVAQGTELRSEPDSVRLPAMTLAWWDNPEGEPLFLQVHAANARGWWFEAHRVLNP